MSESHILVAVHSKIWALIIRRVGNYKEQSCISICAGNRQSDNTMLVFFLTSESTSKLKTLKKTGNLVERGRFSFCCAR